MNSSGPQIRWYAAKSLGELGSMAPAAVAALENATRDENRHVRAAAEHALRLIQAPPDQPAFPVDVSAATELANSYSSPRAQ
jgi:HEAT repeat protein